MKSVFDIALMLVLMGVSGVAPEAQRAEASGTIYIMADGSIEPPTPYIQHVGEVYTFVCDINDSVVIQRDNVTVDGAGYTLQGSKFSNGFYLYSGNNVTIKNVEIKGFSMGIYLQDSSNNSITSNNITGNDYGIYLQDSSGNVLRNNRMSNNNRNFFVFGPRLSDFLNDIDTTNTVDNKPVCYRTNDADSRVPFNAGYVALISCTRITVENLNLSSNGQGILLACTTNSTIIKNNIEDNAVGIMLRYSSDNIISGNNIGINNNLGMDLDSSSKNNMSENNIRGNGVGFNLYDSTDNTISGNNITGNRVGFDLYDSTDNTISGNNIINNESGIRSEGSSSNRIYHNDFINNTVQVATSNSVNHWDSGYPYGGNYWSDYKERYPNASEIDTSGIWDTPYVIDENNQDNYPTITEFPSFLILLPLFMFATFLVDFRFRKRLKEIKAA